MGKVHRLSVRSRIQASPKRRAPKSLNGYGEDIVSATANSCRKYIIFQYDTYIFHMGEIISATYGLTRQYMVKQANAAFQTAMFDEIGTDCGTTLYIDMLITKSNYPGFMYRYIITDNGLVKLDADNIEQYIGKWVKLRDATCCKADKICSKCSGEYLQLLGITNAGLTTTTLYNSMVNKSMKKFHDTSVKTYVINNVNDLLIKI